VLWGLSLSTGAANAESAASPVTFGVWAMSCDEGPCQVFVTLQDRETQSLAVAWSIVADPATGAMTALVRLPLGMALPPGLTVRIDPGTAVSAAYQTCMDDGCLAVVPLDETLVGALRAGKGLGVDFVRYGATVREARFVPLDGFGDALDALKAATATAD
jgi:invasion protein IalB